MRLGIALLGMVGFSVLCQQAVMIGQRRMIDTRTIQPAAPVRYFERGSEAVVVLATANVAQHFEELTRYYEIEAQRAVEKLHGTPLPHGTYTVPGGTKCEVLSQRGTLVEVMWIDGPMVQATAWIHAGDLK